MKLSLATPGLLGRLRAAARGVVEWPKYVLVGVVKTYRLLFKAWLGNACRFEPSCSQYALDALNQHGALVGSTWAGYRLLRCHPWCEGGCDPVPAQAPALFTRLGLVPDRAGREPRESGPAASNAPVLIHQPNPKSLFHD